LADVDDEDSGSTELAESPARRSLWFVGFKLRWLVKSGERSVPANSSFSKLLGTKDLALVFRAGLLRLASMKRRFLYYLVSGLVAAGFIASPSLAASPDQEKEFTDKYKTAFEANDSATLESFLYTKGADPMVLEFFKMMVAQGAGGKISKIELVELSAEDAKKAEQIQDGPGGTKLKLPLKPTKKLKITTETKDANGSSSGTSESFIAEKDGKLVIPVPVAAK
jgi:hypothetical protein